MLGGGFISTMVKHSRMDDARRNMEQAKDDLKKFSRELQDVNVTYHLNLETADFLSFADWFFDGFFVDWMVEERISQAREQVAEAIRQVEQVLAQLRNCR